jgi:hypothetical protein
VDLSDTQTSYIGAHLLDGDVEVRIGGLEAGIHGEREGDERYQFWQGNSLFTGVVDMETGNRLDAVAEFYWFESSLPRNSDFYVVVLKVTASPAANSQWRIATPPSAADQIVGREIGPAQRVQASVDPSGDEGAIRWDWSIPFQNYRWEPARVIEVEQSYTAGADIEGGAMRSLTEGVNIQAKGFVNARHRVSSRYTITLWRWQMAVQAGATDMDWSLIALDPEHEQDPSYHEYFLVLQSERDVPVRLTRLEFSATFRERLLSFIVPDSFMNLSVRLRDVVVSPPEDICPEGQRLEAGRCIPDCPEDFILVADVCVPVCPEGFHVEGEFCVSDCPRGLIPVGDACIPDCGPGSRPEGDRCVADCEGADPPPDCVEDCDPGEHVEDDRCVPDCEPGFRLEGVVCIPDCRAGFVPDGDRCVPDCEQGFHADGDRCVPGCQPGFSEQGGRCVPDCDEGHHAEGDDCVRDCPPGTLVEGDDCVPDCGAGLQVAEGRCVPVCEPGFRVEGNGCVPACDHGFRREGDECVRDCSPGHRLEGERCVLQCDPGFVVRDGLCVPDCGVGRRPAGDRCVDACEPGTHPEGVDCVADVVTPGAESGDDDGCGCDVPSDRGPGFLFFLLLGLARRRR